jgi:transcription-repair coupling factor (superfamily II helicase)
LPDDAVRLLTIARIRERARAAGVARIDAGPAAIAFTPRRGATAPASLKDLPEKNGRLLLREPAHDASDRLAQIGELLLDGDGD